MYTDGESQTESDIPDGIDRAVNGRMSDVYQISKLGHHRRVYHADSETQSCVR